MKDIEQSDNLLANLNKIGDEIDRKNEELLQYLKDNYVRIYNPGDIVRYLYGGLFVISDDVYLDIYKRSDEKINPDDLTVIYSSLPILKTGKIGARYNTINPFYSTQSYEVIGNIKDYPTSKLLKLKL